MKTLTFTFALLFTMSQIICAQGISNQLQVSTSIEDGITIVKWESTNEVNTSYFVIERSFDGITFERIASQPAAGSTHHSKVYTFEDLDTINYLATYKVTVVCMDGTQYSTTCESPENMNIAQTEND